MEIAIIFIVLDLESEGRPSMYSPSLKRTESESPIRVVFAAHLSPKRVETHTQLPSDQFVPLLSHQQGHHPMGLAHCCYISSNLFDSIALMSSQAALRSFIFAAIPDAE